MEEIGDVCTQAMNTISHKQNWTCDYFLKWPTMTKIVTLWLKLFLNTIKKLVQEVINHLHFLKYLFSFQRYSSFKICQLAKWWGHTLKQILLIKLMKTRYLNQFGLEIIEPWQQDLTRCVLQDKIINYVTMATYWVPDHPNGRSFSGFFWHSILVFFSDAWFARSSKCINKFKVGFLSCFNFSGLTFARILETTGEDTKRVCCHGKTI